MGLRIIEIIPNTIQGEGKFSGAACQFIRLSGCRSHCKWCDTKESWDIHAGILMTEKEIVNKLSRIERVCITGGDPLLQDCGPLIRYLKKRGFQVHFEVHSIGEVRAGETTIAPSWLKMADHITFSPKSHLTYNFSYFNELSDDFWEMVLKLVVFPLEESFDYAAKWISASKGFSCMEGRVFLQCASGGDGKIIDPERVTKMFLDRSFPSNVRLSCQIHKVMKCE